MLKRTSWIEGGHLSSLTVAVRSHICGVDDLLRPRSTSHFPSSSKFVRSWKVCGAADFRDSSLSACLSRAALRNAARKKENVFS
ncbi:unnamed protein product [Pleuronectes platessa]|uniref:Uncharacterized protein n=1 Tax=Pleuronectes platessa TaxID=8262 RepID=A0A9N7ZEX2_PLEPL|nr:unnamed protein product [Pleuronectes platessa]